MFGIKIDYSWGDNEDINQYGKFDTAEEAYRKMCELAGKEAYVYNEEFTEDRTVICYFDAKNKKIDLQYCEDLTWCYYRVVKL